MRAGRAQVRPVDQARAALALLALPPPVIDHRVADEVGLPEPQPGPQTVACESKAQIVIYGGHAGGGKTWWLLREALRYYANPLGRAVLLRRKLRQAQKPGGLCDSAEEMFKTYGARSVDKNTLHTFQSGATVSVSGCEHAKNRFDYDSVQVDLVGFDQLEGFESIMFWYIALSRSRTMSGLTTRICATANPVHPSDKTGGWLSSLLMQGGWVDPDTGYAISSESGVVKWFYRDRDTISFFPSKEKARAAFPEKMARGVDPLSMTFIEARLEDNVKLAEKSPDYASKLEGLPWMERQRLIAGNWKVSAQGGGIVRKEWFHKLSRDPSSSGPEQPEDKSFYKCLVRAWDLAGTRNRPGKKAKDRTAGALVGRARQSGRYIISDPVAKHLSPREVQALVIDTMFKDGPDVIIHITQDPGQAGKEQAENYVRMLRREASRNGMAAPKIVILKQTKGKLAKAERFIASAEPARMLDNGEIEIYGNIDVVDGPQVDDMLEELHHFTGEDGGADDFWDVVVDGYNQCVTESGKSAIGVF